MSKSGLPALLFTLCFGLASARSYAETWLVVSDATFLPSEPFDRADILALGRSRQPGGLLALEKICTERGSERKRFLDGPSGPGGPNGIAPPDLDEELSACLQVLERLGSATALRLASDFENAQLGPLTWEARELKARLGDVGTIQLAVEHYFEHPRWGSVLSELASSSSDPRLSAFGERMESPANVPGVGRIARNLAEVRGAPAQRALYRWIRRGLSRPNERRFAASVLALIPRGFAYDRGVDARLEELSRSNESDDAIRALNGLARRGASASRRAIAAQISDADPTTQAAALRALVKLGTPPEQLVPRILDEVSKGAREPFLSEAIRQLVDASADDEARLVFSGAKARTATAFVAFLPTLEVVEVEGEQDLREIRSFVDRAEGRERFLMLRALAKQDHLALVGIPLVQLELDRLYPYLASSVHSRLREQALRVSKDLRPRALAGVLRSRSASPSEKRRLFEQYAELWPLAVVSGGTSVLNEIQALFPQQTGEYSRNRFLELVPLQAESSRFIASWPETRALRRLEQDPSVTNLRAILHRSDRVLAMTNLLKQRTQVDGSFDGASLNAVDAILISLGAPGSTTVALGYRQRRDEILAILPGVLVAPIEPQLIQELLQAVSDFDHGAPELLIGLCHFRQRFPSQFLAWWNTAEGRLAARMHVSLALCSPDEPGKDDKSLPLLVDLAVAGSERSTRVAALMSLAQRELGIYAERLHRLAGESDREIRFWTAASLTNAEQAWTSRLLVSSLDVHAYLERRAMRDAFERMSSVARRSQLEALIRDGTANSFAIELYLESDSAAEQHETDSRLHAAAWAILQPAVEAGERHALVTASRLSHPAAVTRVSAKIVEMLAEPEGIALRR